MEPSTNIATVGATTLISNSLPINERLIEGLANDVDRNEAIDRDTASPMELQTKDCVEETPPVSIFVIEADVVNHTVPDFHQTLHISLDEESRDRADVVTG
jgi:hypothetical protein